MTETTSFPTEAPAEPSAVSSAVPENPYAAPRPTTPTAGSAPASGTAGFSIASLVLGIASIPTGWAIAGILAIVFGFLARSREPQGRTISNWGIVLGFVSLFGWVLVALLGLAFVAPFALWGSVAGWVPGFLHW